jgi:hypothetical protein
MTMKSTLIAYVSLACLFSACSTPGIPRPYFDEDAYGRYYTTESGTVLRVERDGTVLDVTCLPREFAKGTSRKDLPATLCGREKIQVVGKVKKVGEEWDMTSFMIAPETGTCKPLLPFFIKDWQEDKRHSCWNRLWEVPTAVVVYPTVAVAFVGLVTAPIWVPLLLLH